MGNLSRVAGAKHERATRPSAGPGPPHAGAVILAVVLTQLLVVIDFFALNLSLPSMARDFGVTATDLQLVISGYMIALGAFMIPAGRLADIFGRRRVTVIGVTIFGLIFTPAFYVICRWLADLPGRRRRPREASAPAE